MARGAAGGGYGGDLAGLGAAAAWTQPRAGGADRTGVCPRGGEQGCLCGYMQNKTINLFMLWQVEFELDATLYPDGPKRLRWEGMWDPVIEV